MEHLDIPRGYVEAYVTGCVMQKLKAETKGTIDEGYSTAIDDAEKLAAGKLSGVMATTFFGLRHQDPRLNLADIRIPKLSGLRTPQVDYLTGYTIGMEQAVQILTGLDVSLVLHKLLNE